jgi:hypothetical protein
MGRTRKENMMAKYLILKHYRWPGSRRGFSVG